MTSPIRIAVIGAGVRGQTYAEYALAHPEQANVVAVAEPDSLRREAFAMQHNIPNAYRFTDWSDLLNGERTADAVLICTMDTLHTAPTLLALERGYDVLLEKPIAPVLKESVQIIEAAESSGRLLQICHVLRYTSFFRTVREIVQSGRMGRVTHVTHNENLVYWHMAHSFVRGNWRNLDVAGPMILAKCCHDFDILCWILPSRVRWVSSFGALTHFKPENAPEGATLRCMDGCAAADTCKFYAPNLYVNEHSGWPFDILTTTPTIEARTQALENSPYGRCVYHCDNDVVDHQTVNMMLDDETTISLVMNGHSDEEARTMRYDGTLATLYGKFSSSGDELCLHHHRSGEIENIPITAANASRHGGGDFGIMASFINALRGAHDPDLTTARESLESHLLAFAAEESRLTRQTIDMEVFRRQSIL